MKTFGLSPAPLSLSLLLFLGLSSCGEKFSPLEAQPDPSIHPISLGPTVADEWLAESLELWLEEQYLDFLVIETELNFARQILEKLQNLKADAEGRYRTQLSEAEYLALGGGLKILLDGAGFVPKYYRKYVQLFSLSWFRRRFAADKIRMNQQKTRAALDQRKSTFLQVAKEKAERATRKFMQSPQFNRELESVALESAEQTLKRLEGLTIRRIALVIGKQEDKLGRALSELEKQHVRKKFWKDYKKSTRSSQFLKEAALSAQKESRESLRLVRSAQTLDDHLHIFTHQAMRELDRPAALQKLHAENRKLIQQSRQIGRLPRAAVLTYLGVNVAIGGYLLFLSEQKLSLTERQWTAFQADLTKAESLLSKSQAEQESLMQATVEAALAQGLDLDQWQSRDQELQGFIQQLQNYLRQEVPEIGLWEVASGEAMEDLSH